MGCRISVGHHLWSGGSADSQRVQTRQYPPSCHPQRVETFLCRHGGVGESRLRLHGRHTRRDSHRRLFAADVAFAGADAGACQSQPHFRREISRTLWCRRLYRGADTSRRSDADQLYLRIHRILQGCDASGAFAMEQRGVHHRPARLSGGRRRNCLHAPACPHVRADHRPAPSVCQGVSYPLPDAHPLAARHHGGVCRRPPQDDSVGAADHREDHQDQGVPAA